MKSFYIFLLSFSFMTVYSQEETPATSQVFNFISKYQAKIEDGDKISKTPVLPDTIETEVDLDYVVLTKHIDTEYKPSLIPAVTMKINDPLVRLKKHYAEAGIGANGLPSVAYGYNYKRDRHSFFGVKANYTASRTDIDGFSLKNLYGEANANLNYKRFLTKNMVYGGVDYNFRHLNLYGIPNDIIIPSLAENQRHFSGATAYLGMKSSYKDSSKINHKDKIYYTNFFDNNMTMEHQIGIESDLKTYREGNLIKLHIDGQHFFAIDSIASYNTLFNLRPSFVQKGDKYLVDVGVILSGELAALRSKVRPGLFLQAHYDLIPEVFQLYTDVNGGYQRQSFQQVSLMNPFLNLGNGLDNAFTNIDAKLGFRGALSSTITFNLAGGYRIVEKDVLFVNSTDSSLFNQFDIIYDQVNTTSLSGELTHEGKKWKNVINGTFQQFAVVGEDEAWHRPSYQFSHSTKYLIQEKIEVGMDQYVVGKRLAKDNTDNSSIELPAYYDLNLNVNYRLSSGTKVYLNLFNILNNNYQIWNNYPVQGFNFLVGAKFQF